MTNELIHDRGRGPEVVGTRITVYNLLTSFLDPTQTEAEICRIYELAPQQVAAARAYILSNPEAVLAEHLRIEERLANGVRAQQSEHSPATFQKFKKWIVEQEAEKEAFESSEQTTGIPTFRQWLASQPGK